MLLRQNLTFSIKAWGQVVLYRTFAILKLSEFLISPRFKLIHLFFQIIYRLIQMQDLLTEYLHRYPYINFLLHIMSANLLSVSVFSDIYEISESVSGF